MKILIVSMRAIHSTRWVSQLRDSGHEVFYFDILNGGIIKEWDWVEQFTNWRYKFGDFKGRYFLKKYFYKAHKLLENDPEEEFERIIKLVKPDVVQSFVLYKCCVPILKVMQRNQNIKWIYSAWGNDLFYYKNLPKYRKDILEVLPEIDYMFADCIRDINIAKELGFKGGIAKSFPGGGGYELAKYKPFIKKLEDRKIILIKGYEQRFGKCSIVLQAISQILNKLEDYSIVVFGADKELLDYLDKHPVSKKITIYKALAHDDVLRLMGKSLIYIGNSTSDGMPNTLLESIIMGVFPIQSNPGEVTEEIIENNKNGLLINNPNNIDEIKTLILKAINNRDMLQKGFEFNQNLKSKLDYDLIKEGVLETYKEIEEDLEN